MAKLTILRYPDPRLHKIARPVLDVNADIRQLVDDMAQTMYAAPGIGLAATQVDRHLQVIVIDASESRNELQVFINPSIIDRQGEAEQEEGCLSVPGIFEKVRRAEQITVQALNRDGKSFTLKASGTLAVCIQHEMDHLQGKVFVEYLSQLKQSRIKTKMRKLAREAA